MTTEEMEKRWPEVPPFKCEEMRVYRHDSKGMIWDSSHFEVNQESIDEIIEYFQAAKESMNG